MFTVSFLKNTSDKRYVTKKMSTVLGGVECTLKDTTSTTQPTFRVPFNSTIYQANYVYVAELGRYFPIRTIVLDKQIMEIECEESDVLTSFASQIKQLSATIERQSNKFNTYLNDVEYQTYAYNHIVTKEFPNGFRTNERFILITNGGS